MKIKALPLEMMKTTFVLLIILVTKIKTVMVVVS